MQEGSRRGQVLRRCGRSRAREVCGMSPRGGWTQAARSAVTGPRGAGAAGRLPSGPLLPVSLWPVMVPVCASVLPVLLVAGDTVY